MKLDVEINESKTSPDEIFGLTKERADVVDKFTKDLLIEMEESDMPKATVVKRIVEFAESNVEAVFIALFFQSLVDSKAGLMSALLGIVNRQKKSQTEPSL